MLETSSKISRLPLYRVWCEDQEDIYEEPVDVVLNATDVIEETT